MRIVKYIIYTTIYGTVTFEHITFKMKLMTNEMKYTSHDDYNYLLVRLCIVYIYFIHP